MTRTKKTLFLHIGHGKTGSSYLQSVFANSRKVLAENGIFYPEDASDQQALLGEISSGNGMLLTGILGGSPTEAELLADVACQKEQSIFFSSEWLFNVFNETPNTTWDGTPWEQVWAGRSGKEKVQMLKEWAQTRGFERICVLLFIRNPISSSLSDYHQSVKRHGEFQDITQREISSSKIQKTSDCLKLLTSCSGIKLTVRNYSVVSKNLLKVMADWLDIPETLFAEPPIETINRSMTRSELELQRCLNKHLGASGRLLSDPLCNRLPNIVVKKSYPPIEWQRQFWEQQRLAIEEANTMIEPEHRYQFDGQDTLDTGDDYTFSKEQLEIIAESISAHIHRLSGKTNEAEVAELNKEIVKLKEKLAESKKKAQQLKEKLESKRIEIRRIKQRKNWFKRLWRK